MEDPGKVAEDNLMNSLKDRQTYKLVLPSGESMIGKVFDIQTTAESVQFKFAPQDSSRKPVFLTYGKEAKQIYWPEAFEGAKLQETSQGGRKKSHSKTRHARTRTRGSRTKSKRSSVRISRRR